MRFGQGKSAWVRAGAIGFAVVGALCGRMLFAQDEIQVETNFNQNPGDLINPLTPIGPTNSGLTALSSVAFGAGSSAIQILQASNPPSVGGQVTYDTSATSGQLVGATATQIAGGPAPFTMYSCFRSGSNLDLSASLPSVCNAVPPSPLGKCTCWAASGSTAAIALTRLNTPADRQTQNNCGGADIYFHATTDTYCAAGYAPIGGNGVFYTQSQAQTVNADDERDWDGDSSTPQ